MSILFPYPAVLVISILVIPSLWDTHSKPCSSCYKIWSSKCELNQSKNLFPLSYILSFFFFFNWGKDMDFWPYTHSCTKAHLSGHFWPAGFCLEIHEADIAEAKFTGFCDGRSLLCQLLPTPWPCLPSALGLKMPELLFSSVWLCQLGGGALLMCLALIPSSWATGMCSFVSSLNTLLVRGPLLEI